MITARQFKELIQDRLAGSAAFADTRMNYPLPMIARMCDMILPSFLSMNPDCINDMAITEVVSVTSGATSFELKKSPMMGVMSFVEVSDEVGVLEIRDIGTDKSLSRLNPNNKRVIVLGNKKTMYLRGTLFSDLSIVYVPLFSQMDDDDTIDLNGEGEVFGMICQAILANERFMNDKTNNNLVDPA